MKELTYNFIDKSTWGEGEWNKEFDKIQYLDKKTGLPCLIVRNQTSGNFCGYVGIDKTHPLFGVKYGDCSLPGAKRKGKTKGDRVLNLGEKKMPIPKFMLKMSRERRACPTGEDYCNHRPESMLDAHGGITFSGKCQNDEHGICHKVEAGENDDVWWFGFDCAHAGDFSPAMEARLKEISPNFPRFGQSYDKYRNVEYVKTEVANLAKQLKKKGELTAV